MLLSANLPCQPTGESKLRRRLRKRYCIEKKTEHDDSVDIKVLDENPIIGQPVVMRAEGFHNPLLTWRPRTDLDGILGKNFLDGLVRLAQKLAKSITETSSKVYKPNTDNYAVNNSINENKWQDIIDEELCNLDTH